MGRPLDEDMIIKVLESWQKAFKENSHYVSASDLSLVVKDVKELPTIQPEVLACGNGELVAKLEPTYEQVEEYCKRRCLHVVTADFFESTKPQRLGHWILYDKRFPWRTWYKCSECGNYLDFSGVNGGRGEANYCPNCGAKMKGEQDGH